MWVCMERRYQSINGLVIGSIDLFFRNKKIFKKMSERDAIGVNLSSECQLLTSVSVFRTVDVDRFEHSAYPEEIPVICK